MNNCVPDVHAKCSYPWYIRLQKSCNKQAEQLKTTIHLPHMNMLIFPASACPTSLFKHNKSIVVFHCSACLLQDCCKLVTWRTSKNHKIVGGRGVDYCQDNTLATGPARTSQVDRKSGLNSSSSSNSFLELSCLLLSIPTPNQ